MFLSLIGTKNECIKIFLRPNNLLLTSKMIPWKSCKWILRSAQDIVSRYQRLFNQKVANEVEAEAETEFEIDRIDRDGGQTFQCKWNRDKNKTNTFALIPNKHICINSKQTFLHSLIRFRPGMLQATV